MGMTNREKTLDWLYRLRSEIYVYMPKEWLIPMSNALDLAIKALEQEPTTKNDLGVDAISKQAVLNKILKFSVTDGRNVSVTSLWTEVNDLPPITPQEPRWIPISERSPKACEYIDGVARHYLVQNEYGDMLVARYDGEGWEQMYQYEYFEDDVIAWMPLPKPYEPQESEG